MAKQITKHCFWNHFFSKNESFTDSQPFNCSMWNLTVLSPKLPSSVVKNEKTWYFKFVSMSNSIYFSHSFGPSGTHYPAGSKKFMRSLLQLHYLCSDWQWSLSPFISLELNPKWTLVLNMSWSFDVDEDRSPFHFFYKTLWMVWIETQFILLSSEPILFFPNQL